MYVGLTRESPNHQWKYLGTENYYVQNVPMDVDNYQGKCAFIKLQGVYSGLLQSNCTEERSIICEYDNGK